MRKILFESSNQNKLIFFILLLTFFLVPSQTSLFASGLPITNKYSTIIFIIFFSIIVFNIEILKFNIIKILIIFLLCLKLFLSIFPNTGMNLKQYFNNEDFINDRYIKTYDSFWNKKSSFVQTKNFYYKKNFPIDWLVISKINFKKNGDKHFKDYLEYKDLELIYNLSFYIYINNKKDFIIKADGAYDSKINYYNVNSKNNNKYIINNHITLDKGIYKFDGKINYSSNKWSLELLIKENNKFLSAFKKNIIFYDLKNINYFDLKYKIFNILINFLDFFLIIFLIINIFLFLLILKNKIKIEIFLIFSIISFVSHLLLNNFTKYIDLYGSFSVALSFLFLIFLIIFFRKKIEIQNNNIEIIYFILIFPLLTYFFITKFFPEIESISWWDCCDDWTAFQAFARAIVVDGEWLNAGEGVIYYRPGIRYVFAFLHIIFGQSGFAQKLIEPILIFSSCYLFILIMKNFKISPIVILCSCILLISIFLGENYRWNISRGITEYYSLFFISLICYLFTILNLNIIKNYIIVSILGILNIWLREDHIFLIFFCFYLNMIKSNHYNNRNIYYTLFNYTKKNFFKIFTYGLILFFALIVLWLRNLYVGGETGVSHPYNVFTHAPTYDLEIFSNFYMLLTASLWPNLPRITSIFLFGTFIITILRLLELKKIIVIHPALILIVIGCLLPGLIFPLIGYYPRYTIKYLPFCILIFSILFNFNFKKLIENYT